LGRNSTFIAFYIITQKSLKIRVFLPSSEIKMWLSETQKIGVGLTGFGVFFMIMGMIMFFDGGLLAIGNVDQFYVDSFFIRYNTNYWTAENS
jgi:hypothetical protein